MNCFEIRPTKAVRILRYARIQTYGKAKNRHDSRILQAFSCYVPSPFAANLYQDQD